MADAMNAANMNRATHYWQELCGVLPHRYIKLFQPARGGIAAAPFGYGRNGRV
ncbi:MAG: hypothetical protein UZ07_CHB004000418 [Chlorobi bacterium OLB7]|nr:MAG: hypothetical protein UZ07_CHB004000418 [Chlorobi bacterium OLB7]